MIQAHDLPGYDYAMEVCREGQAELELTDDQFHILYTTHLKMWQEIADRMNQEEVIPDNIETRFREMAKADYNFPIDIARQILAGQEPDYHR